MRKSDLANRLNTALNLLDEAADHPRLSKGIREKFAAFASETREELTRASVAGGGGGRTIWRLATIDNPKTGKPVTLELKQHGLLIPSDAKRLGIEHVNEWTEVRAASRSEARQKIEAGGGTRKERVRGKVREVAKADAVESR